MIDNPLESPLGEEEPEQPVTVEVDLEADSMDEASFALTAAGELIAALDDTLNEPEPPAFDDNLADYLEEVDPGAFAMVASELAELVDNDERSRDDWEKTYKEGLKLLGLKYEERSEPWDGACGVTHPMVTEAVVRFQSEMALATFPAQGPVRTKIVGKETAKVKAAARRVQADMNHQLTDVMKDYRPEHERLLWNLPSAGSAFKKIYFDPVQKRPVATFVPAEDIILPYGCTSIAATHRMAHRMRKTPQEIRKLQASGFYREGVTIPDKGYGEQTDIQKAKDEQTGFTDYNDEHLVVMEAVADLCFPSLPECADGLARPFVLTYMKGTNEVLAVRRNWREEDETYAKRQHFVHYTYIPGYGPYGYGLFHLIGGYATSATSILRQLVDAGTLSNLPGGLKSRGLRVKGDDTPIAPGEFRDVDVASGTIRDNILPLPYKEPSQTLLVLLQGIIEEARRFAATADMKVSDMSAQAPVGTTLALLERQLTVMSAVQARLHASLKEEFQILKELIAEHCDTEYGYEAEDYPGEPVPESPLMARQRDYSAVQVMPVSDPNASTMAQRVVQYQAVIQMAQMAPDIYDLPQLHRGMLEVLGIKNAEKLVPLEDDLVPMDPVTENTRMIKGEPTKPFRYQNHQAHIATHMAMLQDPMMQQMIGQNPRAQKIMAAIMDHVAEHYAMGYRQSIEAQLGMALPPEDQHLPPEVENGISGLMAQAAAQVLAQNQQAAAQQQAQQQAQDPVMQMQMMELQLKQADLALKQKQIEGKLAIDVARTEIEKERVAGMMEIEGLKVGEQIARTRNDAIAENEREGIKLGMQIAKDNADRLDNLQIQQPQQPQPSGEEPQ